MLFMWRCLSIPNSQPMPRSISTPRSQPTPWYPLYSSLMFHCSQAPISVATKHHAQPRLPSSSVLSWRITNHPMSPLVTRWPRSALRSYTPWQLEVTYLRGSITWHQFSIAAHPLLLFVPVSTSLTLTIPVYLTLGQVTLPVQIIIHP